MLFHRAKSAPKNDKPTHNDSFDLTDIIIIVPICDEPEKIISRFIDSIRTVRFRENIIFIENYSDDNLKNNVISLIKKRGYRLINIPYSGNKAKALNRFLLNNRSHLEPYNYAFFLDIDQIPGAINFSKLKNDLLKSPDLIAIQLREEIETPNLLSVLYNSMQLIYHDSICYGKNHYNSATLLGGNFIIQLPAFYEAGVFYEESILEDILTSYKLNNQSFKIVYVNHISCKSLPPSNWISLLRQQRRYVIGSIDLLILWFRSIYNSKLNFTQKVSYLQHATVYLSSFALIIDIFYPVNLVLYFKYIILILIIGLSITINYKYLLGILLFAFLTPFKIVFILMYPFRNRRFIVTKKLER